MDNQKEQVETSEMDERDGEFAACWAQFIQFILQDADETNDTARHQPDDKGG